MSRHGIIDSEVGLIGATVLIVGNVIGVSAFVLPGELAGAAGPSVLLAMVAATVPLLFGILMSLQLGSAIPVAGGSYVYASRLVGPFWGFLLPWIAIPGVWAGMLFIGIGFAEYTSWVAEAVTFVPQVNELLLVYALLIPFIVLNVLGIRMVAIVQFLMVATIVAGMVAFIVPGAFQVETANFTPWFPQGYGEFVVAVVAMYFPLRGFRLVVELGEEMKQPAKNIPRVLALSAVIALSLLIGLVAVLVGTTDWRVLGGMDGAHVARVSLEMLPTPLVALVVAAAAMGALTSINMTYTAYSRILMRAARDDIIPSPLARIHDRWDSPYVAVVVLGVPPLVVAPVSPGPDTLAIALSLAILFGLAVGGVSLWNLPKTFPQRYEHSLYRLPPLVLKATAVGAVISAALLWVLLAGQIPAMVGVLLGWGVLGYVFYRWRLRRYEAKGVDLRSRMRRLHDNEQLAED